jgi:hypothetical protein
VREAGPKTSTRLVLLVVAAWLFAWPATPIEAQVTRADSAAILLDAATRLEQGGRTDAARDLYAMILDRFGGTPAADRAREMIAERTGARSASGGRVELQVFSTLYGLWLGVAVPAAFGAEGSEAYGIGLLIGGPAGFLTGLGLGRSRELTSAQARAITYGGLWGTWQGFGWAEVLDLGEGPTCELDFCTSDGGPEERFAGMVLGGLAGIGIGVLLSGRTITDGVATSAVLGSLWGSWFGFSLGFIGDLRDDDLIASSLLAGNAGLFASALIASRTNISRNRARLISIAGVIGALAGGGIDLIARPADDNVLLAIPLVGSIAGLTIGTLATRGFDRTGSPDDGELDGSLLRYDREWGLGIPVPSLAGISDRVGGREVRRPALGLTLFRARF